MDQVKKLAFGVIVVVVMGVITPVGVRAFWIVDERGQVVHEGEVLGRGDEDKQEDKSGPSEKKDDEVRTEVRNEAGERIETRVKEGETRTEIRSGGTRVRLERRDDRVVIRAQRGDG